MKRRGFLALCVAGLAGGCTRSSGGTVFDALKAGGHVIYFRHAATDRRGVDMPDWPRSRQRNLSDFGALQSRRIGEGARARGIPVGEVRVSPFYRCMDMAEIAFGRFEVDRNLVSTSNAEGNTSRRIAYLKRRFATPFEGPNLVLIAHSSNIQDAAGVELGEGEAAVFRPLGSAGSQLVGTIGAELW